MAMTSNPAVAVTMILIPSFTGVGFVVFTGNSERLHKKQRNHTTASKETSIINEQRILIANAIKFMM
jgi:hypothetical protein